MTWRHVRGLALVLALFGPLAGRLAAQDSVTLEHYTRSLEALQRLLQEERLEEARGAARDLRSRAVLWGDETLATDTNTLDAVVAAASAAEGARAGVRLDRLVTALRQTSDDAAPVYARPEVLARLAPVDPLRRGGDVATLRVKPLTLPERVEAALFAVADAVASFVSKLREWLAALRPRRAPGQATPGRTAVAAVAFALAVVAVLTVLVLRSRRRPAELAAPEPARLRSSRRDEDPLSRGASEWERHAGELAAARRWREAIRAWYHAVLVSLFRLGLLHYQKGRTNWEYVARLDPGVAWRPGFIALTSLFDREWYGRRTSDAEAFAECARSAGGVLSAVRGAGEAE